MSQLVDGLIFSDQFDVSNLPAPLTEIVRCDESILQQEGLYLFEQDGVISLRQGGRKAPGPVLVDFVAGASAHRRKYGGGKGQSIAKAVGISSSYKPSVLDATAGLGGDAFVLATLGCQMSLIERHPVVFTLLQNGLQRAVYDPEVDDIIQRMQLHQGNASEVMLNWLESGLQQPDVIYLDPMFPHSKSSADVKKEMKVFRTLVGADEDEGELWAAADQLARCRIVVKRPRHAPNLAGQEPSYVLAGKANRFDIYARQKVAPIAAE